MTLHERLLNRMQRAIRCGETFNRQHLRPVRLDGQHQARPHCLAVHDYRARAAHAVFTTKMGSGETQVITQKVGQQLSYVNLGLAPLAIDGRSNSPAHAVAPLARPAACHKARRVSTPATWRL